jgi:CheY-like chemotaxis protein
MKETYILVAEDDADDRFLLQSAFTEKGYTDRIEFVENGVDLMKFLLGITEKDPADVSWPAFILLDLNMPKKNGREVLAEIKQHSLFKLIPVIVYTTTKSEFEIRKCYELGANSYIVKPTRFDALIKVVEEIRNYWLMTAAIPF